MTEKSPYDALNGVTPVITTVTSGGRTVPSDTFTPPVIASIELKKAYQEIAQLKSESLIDPMTQVANFKAFEMEVRNELKAIDREKDKGNAKSFALVSIDLDGLKGVNDTLGHAAGDALITSFSQRLKSLIRETDMICHKSGDEFWVMAKDATAHQILAQCKRIMRLIEKEPLYFPVENGTAVIKMQASFGVAAYDDKKGLTTAETIMHTADENMYTHKSQKGTTRGNARITYINEPIETLALAMGLPSAQP